MKISLKKCFEEKIRTAISVAISVSISVISWIPYLRLYLYLGIIDVTFLICTSWNCICFYDMKLLCLWEPHVPGWKEMDSMYNYMGQMGFTGWPQPDMLNCWLDFLTHGRVYIASRVWQVKFGLSADWVNGSGQFLPTLLLSDFLALMAAHIVRVCFRPSNI